MTEDDPSRRRDVVVTVVEAMRGGDVAVVEGEGFGGYQRAVIAVRDQVNAEHDQQQGKRIHSGCDLNSCDCGARQAERKPAWRQYSNRARRAEMRGRMLRNYLEWKRPGRCGGICPGHLRFGLANMGTAPS